MTEENTLGEAKMPAPGVQRVAELCAQTLLSRDEASGRLGMKLEGIRQGFARLRMHVRADMLNGHGMCHGGIIFTLADTAFAVACNMYNEVTVAAAASIDFLAPARLNEGLIADARELWRSKRNGIYEVFVSNQRGEQIALFRGRCQSIGGPIVREPAPRPNRGGGAPWRTRSCSIALGPDCRRIKRPQRAASLVASGLAVKQMTAVWIKRVYEPPSPRDGVRVLVDRLWPHGLSKSDAGVDLWMREIAPSTTLRRWFGHDPTRWREFRRRYRVELRGKTELIEELRGLMRNRRLTLVYSARDERHNQAVVLREALLG